MRSTLCLSAMGFVFLAAASMGACGGDETGTGGTGATGTTQSTSTGMPTTTATTGGEGGMGMGGMGMGGTGMGGMGMGGMGGMSGEYASCGDCTEFGAGAPSNECKAKREACEKDANCLKIYDCAYAKCQAANMEGGCCTIKCFKDSGAPQAAFDLFKSFDSCVYCQTCKQLCSDPAELPTNATEYCKVFEPGGDAACPP